MTEAVANYEKYFQMGREAFLAGKPCRPINDPVYMAGYNNEWKDARIGDEKSRIANEASKAWTSGWTMANLSA